MRIDGRHTRWDEHRATRREELVSHALRAIRVHGPGVGMDDIATRAGTSKTVIYRHFGDRAGLHAAVVESVHAYIRDTFIAAMQVEQPADLGHLATTLTDAYLALVERDPQIYRFVIAGPGAEGAPGTVPVVIADYVADMLVAHTIDTSISDERARTWAHGLVGFIKAAADRWMAAESPEPRAAVVAHVSALFTPAFTDALDPRS